MVDQTLHLILGCGDVGTQHPPEPRESNLFGSGLAPSCGQPTSRTRVARRGSLPNGSGVDSSAWNIIFDYEFAFLSLIPFSTDELFREAANLGKTG